MNVVDLAATHGTTEAVRRKLTGLEAEKATLQADLRDAPIERTATNWHQVTEEAAGLLVDLGNLVQEAGRRGGARGAADVPR